MRYGAAIPHPDIGFVSDRRVVSEVTALRGAVSGAPECGVGWGSDSILPWLRWGTYGLVRSPN